MVDGDSACDGEAFGDLLLRFFSAVGEGFGAGFTLSVGVGEYDDL